MDGQTRATWLTARAVDEEPDKPIRTAQLDQGAVMSKLNGVGARKDMPKMMELPRPRMKNIRLKRESKIL